MTIPAGDPGPVIERLIRIETKVDVSLATQDQHSDRIRALEVDNTPGGHADHETRIRRLERSMWLIAGAAAAGGGVAGQLVAGLIK
jgi:hypothetical protein